MSNSPKILKFLTTIRDLRASAIRSRIGYVVWAGHHIAASWNSLINDPQLAGAIIAEQHQRAGRKGKMRRGRPCLRYALTCAGRKLMRDLLKAQVIAQETARKVAQNDQEAAQRARQDEIERKAQEKLQAALNARSRYPSAARKRSAKDIADRLAWRRKTFLNEQLAAEPAAPAVRFPAVPIAPVEPAQDDNRDWQRYVSLPTRPAGFVPSMQIVPVDSKSQALLARIAQAGYRVKDGKVLFNGNQWIAPHEWARRMPGVLD